MLRAENNFGDSVLSFHSGSEDQATQSIRFSESGCQRQLSQAMVVHIFNPCTSLCSKPVWSTRLVQGQSELHRETLAHAHTHPASPPKRRQFVPCMIFSFTCTVDFLTLLSKIKWLEDHKVDTLSLSSLTPCPSWGKSAVMSAGNNNLVEKISAYCHMKV